MEQDVDARRPAVQRALQQPLDMVAVAGHMVEIRPVELARARGIEEQAVHVGSRPGRGVYEPVEPVDGLQVAVIVDGNQPGPDERLVMTEAAGDRARRKAQEKRQRAALDVQVAPSGGTDRDIVDQRFEYRVRPVAHQQLQNGGVRIREAGGARQIPEPPARPVGPPRPGRPLVLQRLPEVAELFHRNVVPVGFPAAQPPPAPHAVERDEVFPVGHPPGQRPGFAVAVAQARGGVRQVAGEQMSFVSRQHGLSPDCGDGERKGWMRQIRPHMRENFRPAGVWLPDRSPRPAGPWRR